MSCTIPWILAVVLIIAVAALAVWLWILLGRKPPECPKCAECPKCPEPVPVYIKNGARYLAHDGNKVVMDDKADRWLLVGDYRGYTIQNVTTKEYIAKGTSSGSIANLTLSPTDKIYFGMYGLEDGSGLVFLADGKRLNIRNVTGPEVILFRGGADPASNEKWTITRA